MRIWCNLVQGLWCENEYVYKISFEAKQLILKFDTCGLKTS